MEEEYTNPVFADRIIQKFAHYPEVDKTLIESLQWTKGDELFVSLLPIVDNFPENKRGIIRTFIANSTDESFDLSIYYSLSGWYSNLRKVQQINFIETITISPGEVWFGDIVFRSSIKQGKNYFQLLLYKDANIWVSRRSGRMKRKLDIKQFITMHIEYSQIRDISEKEHIEQNNFLGMSSKAYINPEFISYWLFYSLFGNNRYKKENVFILMLKILGVLSGVAFTILPFILTEIFPTFVIPLGIILSVVSLLSILTLLDDKHIKLIKRLNLTSNKKLGSLTNTQVEGNPWLHRYCIRDINFGVNKEDGAVNWKLGALKLYQKLIPKIAELVGTKQKISVLPDIVEEEKEKEKKKRLRTMGIQFEEQDGIQFKDEIEAVIKEAKGFSADYKEIKSETSISPQDASIETKTSISPQDASIETKTSISPQDASIETKTSISPDLVAIQPAKKGIETDVKTIVSDTSISLEEIPMPKMIPREEKSSIHKSVKDSKKEKKK